MIKKTYIRRNLTKNFDLKYFFKIMFYTRISFYILTIGVFYLFNVVKKETKYLSSQSMLYINTYTLYITFVK